MVHPFLQTDHLVERPDRLYRPHPGEVIKRRVLDTLAITPQQLSQTMGEHADLLNDVLNKEKPIDISLAEKLAQVSGISVQAWMQYQHAYDAHQAVVNNTQIVHQVK